MNVEDFIINGGATIPNPNYKKGSKKTPKTILTTDVTKVPSTLAEQITELEDYNPVLNVSEPIENYTKYNVFPNRYNADVIDRERAENQSAMEQTGHMLMQSASEVTVGTALGLSDMFDALGSVITADKNRYERNEIGKAINEFKESIDEEYAIYRTDPNKNFDVGDYGWYMSNLPSVLSTVTLMVPGMAMAKGASLVGKVAATTGKFAADVTKVGKVVSGINKIIPNAVKATRAAKAINRAAKVATTNRALELYKSAAEIGINGTTMRLVENYQEAVQTHDTIVDTAKTELSKMTAEDREKFYKRNPEYVGMNDDDIASDISNRSADETFKTDWWNIGFDIMQVYALKNMWKGFRARPGSYNLNQAQSDAISALTGKAATDSEKAAMGFIKRQAIKGKNLTKSIGLTTWAEANEGVEEAVNYIAQQEGNHYANYLLGKEKKRHFGLWSEELDNYLQDPATYESALWGVIGGVIFQGIGSGVGRLKNRIIHKEKLSEEQMRKAEINARKLYVDTYKKTLDDINNGIDPYNDGAALVTDEEKENARNLAKQDFLNNLAINAAKVGNTDYLTSYLKDKTVRKYFVDNGFLNEREANEIANEASKIIDDISNDYDIQMSMLDSYGINPYVADIIASNNIRLKQNNKFIEHKMNEQDKLINSIYDSLDDTVKSNQAFIDFRKKYELAAKIEVVKLLREQNKRWSKLSNEKAKLAINRNNALIEEFMKDLNDVSRAFVDINVTRQLDGNDKATKRYDEYIEDKDDLDRNVFENEYDILNENSRDIVAIHAINPTLSDLLAAYYGNQARITQNNFDIATGRETALAKAEYYMSDLNEAANAEIKAAKKRIIDLLTKYDDDQSDAIVDYIKTGQGNLNFITNEELAKLNEDVKLIDASNSMQDVYYKDGLQAVNNKIKEEKRKKPKSVVNGNPTNEEHSVPEVVEDETQPEEGTATNEESTTATEEQQPFNPNDPSTGGIQEEIDTIPFPEAPAVVNEETLTPEEKQAVSIEEKKFENEKKLNDFNNRSFKGLGIKLGDMIRSGELTATNYTDVNTYSRLIDEIVNEAIHEGVDGNEVRQFITSYIQSFGIRSVGKKFNPRSAIDAISNAAFDAIAFSKIDSIELTPGTISALDRLFNAYSVNNGIKVGDKTYLSLESLLRYVKDATNSNESAIVLYESLKQYINNNLNDSNYVIVDKDDIINNVVLENAIKTREEREREIDDADRSNNRLILETTKEVNEAIEKLNPNDKLSYSVRSEQRRGYTNYFIDFKAGDTTIGTINVPTIGRYGNFIFYNDQLLYNFYEDRTSPTGYRCDLKDALINLITSDDPKLKQLNSLFYDYISTNDAATKEAIIEEIITNTDYIARFSSFMSKFALDNDMIPVTINGIAKLYNYISVVTMLDKNYNEVTNEQAMKQALIKNINNWFTKRYNGYKLAYDMYKNSNIDIRIDKIVDNPVIITDEANPVKNAIKNLNPSKHKIAITLQETIHISGDKPATVEHFKPGSTVIVIPRRNGSPAYVNLYSNTTNDVNNSDEFKSIVKSVKDAINTSITSYVETPSKYNNLVDLIKGVFLTYSGNNCSIFNGISIVEFKDKKTQLPVILLRKGNISLFFKEDRSIIYTERKGDVSKNYKINDIRANQLLNQMIDETDTVVRRQLIEADNSGDLNVNASNIIQYRDGKFNIEIKDIDGKVYHSSQYNSYNEFVINNNLVKVTTEIQNGSNFAAYSTNSKLNGGVYIKRVDDNNGIPPVEGRNTKQAEPASNEGLNIGTPTNAIEDIFNNTETTDQQKTDALIKFLTSNANIDVMRSFGIVPSIIHYVENFVDENGNPIDAYASYNKGTGEFRITKKFVDRVINEKDGKHRGFTILLHEGIHAKLNTPGNQKLINNVNNIFKEFQRAVKNGISFDSLTNQEKEILNRIANQENIPVEEFICESLTNNTLVRYLNRIETKDRSKKTLFERLIDYIVQLFNMNVNEKSLLHKEIRQLSQIFDDSNNNNNTTTTEASAEQAPAPTTEVPTNKEKYVQQELPFIYNDETETEDDEISTEAPAEQAAPTETISKTETNKQTEDKNDEDFSFNGNLSLNLDIDINADDDLNLDQNDDKVNNVNEDESAFSAIDSATYDSIDNFVGMFPLADQSAVGSRIDSADISITCR